jgi:hypothetical protein
MVVSRPDVLVIVVILGGHERAVTVADIATADGKSIAPDAMLGQFQDNRFNNYEFPRQPPSLSKDHWKLWTKAIQDEFEKAYSERGTQHQLRQPLWAWLEDLALTAHCVGLIQHKDTVGLLVSLLGNYGYSSTGLN